MKTQAFWDVLGIQWSEACWNIPSKGQLLYLEPPSKSSAMLGLLEGAHTAFQYNSLTHLWGTRRLDSLGWGHSVKGFVAGP